MDIWRVALLGGLILHKLVWEFLKSRSPAVETRPLPVMPWQKRLVKTAKAGVLLFLLVQTLFLELLPITDQPATVRVLGSLLYCAGLATALAGRIQLGENWANIEDARVKPTQALVSNGIYAYIRHPIYAGDFLLLVGLELALNSWLVALCIIPMVIVIKRALAEELLLTQSIRGYAAYQARTKMFIPYVV